MRTLFSRPITWASLFIIVFAGAVCLLPFRAKSLVPASLQWAVEGRFQLNGVYPTTTFDPAISGYERRGLLWASWCGNDTNTGKIESPPFNAPAVLEILVAGYPGNADIHLFLQREDSRIRVPLFVGTDRDPQDQWQRFQWWIPASLRNQRVRLVAVDNATGSGGWIGISAPRTLSVLGLLHQQLPSALLLVFGFIFDFGFFLMPGLALASVALARRPGIGAVYVVILIVAVSATLGYASFWAFFFAKLLGKVFCYAVYLTSASILIFSIFRGIGIKAVIQRVSVPFAYAFVAGILYLCFLFLFANPAPLGADYAGRHFFSEPRPGDNVIPLIFADKIYGHQPLRPFCCGDWLSSDRPPLQAGILLLERPLHVIHNGELDYELLSAALQCLWICGVWCFLNALGASPIRIRQSLAFLIFSGFLFYNTTYTWPKLLAAAFILFILSVVFIPIRSKRTITPFETGLAAACLGLALMAHTGSVFSLAAFVVVGLYFRRLFTLRRVMLGFAVLCVYVLPWSAYQKFVDPPGNRLLKMHLAGSPAIDSRSALQAIIDAYHSHSWSEIIHSKLSHFALLGGKKPLDTFGIGDFKTQGGLRLDRVAVENSRTAQREWIWNAVGLLNVGWLAGLFLLFSPRRRGLAIPYAGWLILAVLVDLSVWSLVTFGPHETITTHSSYADILLLSIGLLGLLLALPRFVYFSLFILQLFNFFAVWVWTPARGLNASAEIISPALQLPLLILGGILAVVMLLSTIPFSRIFERSTAIDEAVPAKRPLLIT